MTFVLASEVKVGDILTALSVLVATASLSYAYFKDRALRRRELADKIRRAAAEVLVASDRWVQLACRYFYDCQARLTDADAQLISTGDVTETRDVLWKASVDLESDVSHKLIAEKLEGAYIALYGYDPSIHELYAQSLSQLREIFTRAHVEHLTVTQRIVLRMEQVKAPYKSAHLGNLLREATGNSATCFKRDAFLALDRLRSQMLRIAQATDTEVINRTVVINDGSPRVPGKPIEPNVSASV